MLAQGEVRTVDMGTVRHLHIEMLTQWMFAQGEVRTEDGALQHCDGQKERFHPAMRG